MLALVGAIDDFMTLSLLLIFEHLVIFFITHGWSLCACEVYSFEKRNFCSPCVVMAVKNAWKVLY